MKLSECRAKRAQDPEYQSAKKALRWRMWIEDRQVDFDIWWRSISQEHQRVLISASCIGCGLMAFSAALTVGLSEHQSFIAGGVAIMVANRSMHDEHRQ